ncbi:hypothetical protein [Tautonia plasticadhaerens]|uniref:Uncharacterized protein n=1 Tax=Tautonia plasticadhaerens TaxID=2527974 RepID=A0A518GYH9_9BACT|nr:hypothetical protein [Tautonia plasticadhaerens]QDV33656.1 hypothetical protein ElP_15320 [Tautonia plasticadhaerens]
MWPFPRPPVPFEQAVYGSFPFWHRGYDLLGRSPDCRDPWIRAMKETCQRLGERPRGAAPPAGVVSRWLADGTWMVLHPFSPGSDDVGRPDAVAFHAVFLDADSGRRAGYRPMRLAPAFREDFGPGDGVLAPGSITLPRPGAPLVPDDPRADTVAEALLHGRRALVESGGPIDRLAEQVWERLPVRHRHRRSLATWAFADAGLFDLIGLPRLSGIDPSDRRLLLVPAGPEGQAAPGEGAEGDAIG